MKSAMVTKVPTQVYERQPVSEKMEKALIAHIRRERQKRKLEAEEAEKNFEKKIREEEEKRRKKEKEISTIEDIKNQIIGLNKELDNLKGKKHDYFMQLKRLLNDENMKKQVQQHNKFENHQQNIHMMTSQGNKYHQYHIMTSQNNIMTSQSTRQQPIGMQQQRIDENSLHNQMRMKKPNQYNSSTPTSGRSYHHHKQDQLWQDSMAPHAKIPRMSK